jgi:hypothetical protein
MPAIRVGRGYRTRRADAEAWWAAHLRRRPAPRPRLVLGDDRGLLEAAGVRVVRAGGDR